MADASQSAPELYSRHYLAQYLVEPGDQAVVFVGFLIFSVMVRYTSDIHSLGPIGLATQHDDRIEIYRIV
jgi:hypothetical protein